MTLEMVIGVGLIIPLLLILAVLMWVISYSYRRGYADGTMEAKKYASQVMQAAAQRSYDKAHFKFYDDVTGPIKQFID